MLPLKESARARIVEVVNALKPHIAAITAQWRARMFDEFQFDGRIMAALERLNIGTGFGICCHSDFAAFLENLTYFGTRLSKLNVDTRTVARSLELYQSFCEQSLQELSPMARAEAVAALETFTSTTFVAVAGAYFDAQRSESQAVLSVLEAELSAPSLSALLDRVLRVTAQTFHACVGAILLRERGTDHLRPEAVFGLDYVLDPEIVVPVGRGFTGQIALTGEPAVLPDLDTSNGLLNPVLRTKAQALWGMPMKIENEVIGVLIIGFARPYDWLPSERELLRAIADRSALAIERARMTDALREREARIAELTAHLIRAQEDERKRISRELHDATGQQLMVIRLYLGMLSSGTVDEAVRAKVQETVGVVDQTIESIRRIIARLSPLVLQELGLVAAVRKEAKDFSKRTGVRTRVAISDSVGRLSPETEIAIYRVVQEALHNVAKHAQASTVNLQMARADQNIALNIQDNGIGITGTAPALGRNFGLAGMKERVAMLGGTLRVASQKQKGTRIEISVPATEPQEAGTAPQSAADITRQLRPYLVRHAAAGGATPGDV